MRYEYEQVMPLLVRVPRHDAGRCRKADESSTIEQRGQGSSDLHITSSSSTPDWESIQAGTPNRVGFRST